jgi:hypothetical protein
VCVRAAHECKCVCVCARACVRVCVPVCEFNCACARACVRACVRACGRAGTGASGCNCTNLVCAQLGFGQASVDARPRVPDDFKRIVFGPSCQATYNATDKCKRTKCNMEREACNMQHPTNDLERFVLGPVMPQWRILSACNGRSYPNTQVLGWTRHRQAQAQQTRLRVVLLVLDAVLRNQLTIRIKNDETGRRRPCIGSQHTACHTHGVHFVSCVFFFSRLALSSMDPAYLGQERPQTPWCLS